MSLAAIAAGAVALVVAAVSSLPVAQDAGSPTDEAEKSAGSSGVPAREHVDDRFFVATRVPEARTAPLEYVQIAVGAHAVGQVCFRYVDGSRALPMEKLYVPPSRTTAGVELSWLVLDDQAPRLEVAEALVDTRTLGSRIVAQRTIPLAPIARERAGVRAFAYRDAGGDVHLLVPTTGTTEVRDARGAAHASQCAYSEAVLAAADVAAGRASAQLVGSAREGKHGYAPLVVNASLSQTASDREPLLSVSVVVDDR